MTGVGLRGPEGHHVFREIITRAVYGRGQEVAHGTVAFASIPESARKILGTTATEFKVDSVDLKGGADRRIVSVSGHFDVHVWFTTGDDTKIAKQTVTATIDVPIQPQGREEYVNEKVRAWVVRHPECKSAVLDEAAHRIEVEVQTSVAAEVTGETKLKVLMATPAELTPVTPERQPMKPKPAPVPDWEDDEEESKSPEDD